MYLNVCVSYVYLSGRCKARERNGLDHRLLIYASVNQCMIVLHSASFCSIYEKPLQAPPLSYDQRRDDAILEESGWLMLLLAETPRRSPADFSTLCCSDKLPSRPHGV